MEITCVLERNLYIVDYFLSTRNIGGVTIWGMIWGGNS